MAGCELEYDHPFLDNHTACGRRLIGYDVAAEVAGAFNPPVHRTMPRQQIVPAWVNATVSMTQPGNEAAWAVDDADAVSWRGWCKLADAATPGVQVEVARLPRALWPDGAVRAVLKATATGGSPIAETVTVIVDEVGVMRVWFDTATPGGFYLDGLNYTRAFTQVTK